MTRPLVWKPLSRPRPLAGGLALVLVALAIAGFAWFDGGFLRRAWPLLAGALFGIALQRGELSLIRAWRDLLVLKDSGQLLGLTGGVAVAAALTLGGLAASGAALPPAGARIAPVSWLLPVAAFAFGIGAVMARGSLMVHLRRLGEGSLVAVPALLATFAGFVLAITTWPWAHRSAIGQAPAVWLPDALGHAATLALELAALAVCAAALWRWRPRPEPRPASLSYRLLVTPWPALPAASIVGLVAAACYAAGEPLGLTGECAAVARFVATWLGLAPRELPGLDTGIGGLVVPLRGLGFSGHVVIVTGVVAGSFAAALASGHFRIVGMTVREAIEMAAGGLLLGWGGMIGLGTVTGAVISGIAVGALSGWVFLAFASLGVIAGLKLDTREAVTHPPPDAAPAPVAP